MGEITEPIVGFRRWTSPLCSNELFSLTAEYIWIPGVNKAECQAYLIYGGIGYMEHKCTESPQQSCHCGLQAFYDVQFGFGGINGLIRGWGRVQLHPNGWRSEFAEVVALIDICLSRPHSQLQSLATHYGVPLISERMLKTDPQAVMSEFGQLVPKGLRPIRPTPPARPNHHPV